MNSPVGQDKTKSGHCPIFCNGMNDLTDDEEVLAALIILRCRGFIEQDRPSPNRSSCYPLLRACAEV